MEQYLLASESPTPARLLHSPALFYLVQNLDSPSLSLLPMLKYTCITVHNPYVSIYRSLAKIRPLQINAHLPLLLRFSRRRALYL